MFNELIKKDLEKIEKQLLCFETKNIYDKFHQSLCEMFANFILDLRSNSIDEALHKLDKIYQNNIEIIENKIYFRTYDVSKIAALVFQKLYEENKNIAFETYIELIENKIYENKEWYYLDFGIWNEYENIHIKNYFFEKAIEYIKENQINLQSFFDSFKEKDICRFYEDIPAYFDDLYDFFLWPRNSGFIDCFYNIHFYTSPKIDKLYYLIQTIINFYDYNTYYVNYKQENPIFKLFNLNNHFINGVLLSLENIRLNIFLLKHFEYSIFGFINLIKEMYKKANEKYFKFLVNQLVEVFFKHFYNLTSKEQFHKVIFTTLNGLIIKNNDLKFEVIDKIFGQLEIIEIYKEAYIKEFLFSYIFSDIVKLQLKFNTIESYFLLSKYFKLANKLDIKVNNCLQISVLCKIENLLNEDNLFLDFNFIEKIDFSLFYNPLYKDKLLNLLNIDEKKQTWQEIQAQRKKKRIISSSDKQEPKNQIKLYFKILSDVFVKTYDKDIQDKIIGLAKHFGLDVEFGIFEDFIFDRDFFYEKFLKILNLFNEKFFDTFLYELQIKNEIFKLIKLYNYTYSLKRKEKILNTIKRLEKFNFDFWEKFSRSKKNVIEAIELLISNQLFELANKILDFIDFYNKEIEYLKCEKEILDLFFDNKSKDEKFRKLHQIKYPQDDKNRGIESLHNKCEEYKTLIRALMFFDDEPEKTAIILENEIKL